MPREQRTEQAPSVHVGGRRGGSLPVSEEAHVHVSSVGPAGMWYSEVAQSATSIHTGFTGLTEGSGAGRQVASSWTKTILSSSLWFMISVTMFQGSSPTK